MIGITGVPGQSLAETRAATSITSARSGGGAMALRSEP